MAGDARSLEILIKARDLATAEFQKTQSWLDSLSGTSKKTTDEISKGFKGNVLTSIRDSVKELKAWIGAFSVIKAGRELLDLASGWLEVRQRTREARDELEFYVRLQGGSDSRTRSLLDAQKELALPSGQTGRALTDEQAKSVAIIADKFAFLRATMGGLTDETQALSKDAQLLAERMAAFKGDPVAAFQALAEAQAKSSFELNKRLGLQEKDELREKALAAIRKERLAIEQDFIAAVNEEAATMNRFRNPQQAAEYREQAKAARDLAEQYRQQARAQAEVVRSDPVANRQAALRERAELVLLDAQIRNSRAQAERDRKRDFSGGLLEGMQQFRDELNDFHQQGVQTVTSLLGGVRDIGVGIVDGLVTHTLRGRDALKKFGEDMLRMLANLVAQLTLNRGLALLFNAIVPAAGGAPPGSGGAGAGPTPGAPGTGSGLGTSSYGGGFSLPSGLRNIGNRTIGGGSGGAPSGWGGSPTFNIILQATDTDGLERLAPKLVAIIKRALRSDRELQLEVKGASA